MMISILCSKKHVVISCLIVMNYGTVGDGEKVCVLIKIMEPEYWHPLDGKEEERKDMTKRRILINSLLRECKAFQERDLFLNSVVMMMVIKGAQIILKAKL
jgi:hypothetical protein